jgi:hypothetical protein
VSLNVYFQPNDVGLIQGLVFDYVRGKGTLELPRNVWAIRKPQGIVGNRRRPFAADGVNDTGRRSQSGAPSHFDSALFVQSSGQTLRL